MTKINSQAFDQSPEASEQIDKEINSETLSELSSLSGGNFKPMAPSQSFRARSFKTRELELQIDKFDPSKIRELAGDNCTATSDTGVMGCPG